uniref:DUF6538 domain-containing protein n=1 Tax=OCS116 cluster bacterium TaxID=2030921 RepID=A0A2A4YTN0_9PROT
MMSTDNNSRHLYLRGKTWWYYRRVPAKIAAVLSEKSRQRYSLKTGILVFAQHKRNQIEIAQNEYWSELIISDTENFEQNRTHHAKLINLIVSDSVQLTPLKEISFTQKLEDLAKRIEVLENKVF